MFTGIVEGLGKIERSHGRIEVHTPLSDDLTAGESICVSGVCLTVVSKGAGLFTADVSEETLLRTTLGSIPEGSSVNLERAVAASGRLGGHVMQGHVDGVAKVSAVASLPGSTVMKVRLEDPALSRYVVEKGSIAVDGVSLTVAGIAGNEFEVSLIPATLGATNLGERSVGDLVNVEVDILAKYVEKMISAKEG